MLAVKLLTFLGFVVLSHGGKLTDLINDIKNKKDELDAYANKKAESLVFILKEEILKLQRVMPRGIPSIGVPPLDPFKIGDLSFSPLELNMIKFRYVELKDVMMYGLKNFTFSDFSIDLTEMYVNFNMTFGLLKFYGTYQADGRAMDMFPFGGSGKFELISPNMRMLGTCKIKHENERLQIIKMGIKLKNMVPFEADFGGMKAGGPLAGEENDVLQGAITNAFNEKLRVDAVSEWVVNNSQAKLNAILGTVNFDFLLEETVQSGKVKPGKDSSGKVKPGKESSGKVQTGKSQPTNTYPAQGQQSKGQPVPDQSNTGFQANNWMGYPPNGYEVNGYPSFVYPDNGYQPNGFQGNVYPPIVYQPHDHPYFSNPDQFPRY